MKLIITRGIAKETFCLYDTETENLKSIPYEEGQENTNCDNTRAPHRPFGITWDANNIYIASRKSLLVYDNELKWVDKIELLDENTHQIAMAGNKIAVCMTRKDCVGLLDPVKKEIELYHADHGKGEYPTLGYPSKPLRLDGEEQYHINTVLPLDGKVYFLKQKPLGLGSIDLSTGEVMNHDSNKTKRMTHGILAKSGMECCDFKTLKASGVVIEFFCNAHIRRFDWLKQREAHRDETHKDNRFFWRGMAGTYEETLFAYSNLRPVASYHESMPAGFSNGKTIDGPICDIRRIDGQDDTHHNPHPFPYAWE